jgi:N-acetylglutamate synthase-like GNAT family acetyltransferase
MSRVQMSLRCDLRPGDLGRLVELHGVVYAAEFGLDHTFEAYVAGTVADIGRRWRPERDRLWLAEADGRLVGCVAILGRDDDTAQLRWFLVDPSVRGRGLGRSLLDDAIAFCRSADYRSIYLWTVDACVDAARLYLAAGFHRTEVKAPGTMGGRVMVEQRYDLTLSS